MNKILLVKYGEIALKGKNRFRFEDKLISNLKVILNDTKGSKVKKIYGRLLIEVPEIDEEIINKVRKVFGITSICPAISVSLDLQEIKDAALILLTKSPGKTFKVNTKRPNKAFPITSPEISREVGAHLLINTEDWTVDVHKPDAQIYVEVRPEGSFIYTQGYPGNGGLPVGVTGRAILLISGGIDSPVAGWLSMKRGVEIVGLHFHSYPFTSERAKQKVLDLVGELTTYKGFIKVYINHFTEIQKAIKEDCPRELYVTIMRRMMFRIAAKIAERETALALITGENLGQVASQTLESMSVINEVVSLPVLRPLVTMDKIEIIDMAKRINTYETSIQPYEDCCTIFLPENPATKPKLHKVVEAEEKLQIEQLIEESMEKTEVVYVNKNVE
ncbi:MAG: thiamine biosynthesis protein ThiI [Desulfitibacter sp. BRH_c19]|nr:MAG: thiamine biosynthesis protein ThiI [Desulfitibacter sp. BRH_c19]